MSDSARTSFSQLAEMKEVFAAFGKLVDHLFQVPPWILRCCEIDL